MATNKSQLFLIAVLRYSDKSILASYIQSKEITAEGVRECIASNASIVTGKRYTSQGSNYSVHFIQDTHGRVYAIVTSPNYTSRVAFSALDELVNGFGKQFGPRCASATENSLSKTCRPYFEEIATKYSNPATVDTLVNVQDKIDVVKSNMKENIQQILQNDEKIKNIEEASIHLNEQAAAFQKSSTALSEKMFWKKWKMRLLVGGLIVVLLILIIVPLVVTSKSSSK